MSTPKALADPPTGDRVRLRAPGGTEFPADLLDWVADMILRRTGLTFPPSRRPLLERAVARWWSEIDAPARERLMRGIAPSDHMWAKLISLVTVGETYFLRHGEQLDVLRDVLSQLIAERSHQLRPSLRLWSAGCATGEEAYTLAIMLLEMIPDAHRWRLQVLGTDIDQAALEVARRASYRRWSFRVDGDYAKRWFDRVDSEWSVAPAARALVSFEEHNLVAASDWPPAGLGGLADVILCRNVAMYMARDVARNVVSNLHRALAPGGWLILGPAEPAPEEPFIRHAIRGFVLGQRQAVDAAGKASTTPEAGPTTLIPVRRPLASSRAPQGRRDGTPTPGGERRANTTQIGHLRMADAVALANVGRLDDAEVIVRAVLRDEPTDPSAYLLLATVAEARGDLDGACLALGRVLYLRPDETLAMFRLGLLEWRRGRIGPARHQMRRVLALLDRLADDEVVDVDHGIDAGAVRSVARALVA